MREQESEDKVKQGIVNGEKQIENAKASLIKLKFVSYAYEIQFKW